MAHLLCIGGIASQLNYRTGVTTTKSAVTQQRCSPFDVSLPGAPSPSSVRCLG